MTIRKAIALPALLSALAVGLALPMSAQAAPGVVVGGTDIFAGPSPAYPVVGGLPPGAPIEIFGCQPGWGWCDVSGGPYRGWAPSSRVQVLYNGAPGLLGTYGPLMGLPLIGFAFNDYWGAHYRSRPWFSNSDRWGGGHGPGGPAGRGPNVHGQGRPGGGGGPGRPGGQGVPLPAARHEGGFPGNAAGPGRGGGNRGGENRGGGMPRGAPPHAGPPPGGNHGGGHEGGGHEGGHGGGHDDHHGR